MFSRVSSAVTAIGTLFPRSGGACPTRQHGSAHDFTLTSIDGSLLPLREFSGKALLIVNTASLCGFRSQYAGLQETWVRYQGRGLVVLGVPSNDFGGQEPKRDDEIDRFCEDSYGVTFPLAAKTAVYGPNAHPFYAWAGDTLGEKSRPRWNFHKYLVNSEGQLVAWFNSTISPRSRKLRDAIEHVLPGAVQ